MRIEILICCRPALAERYVRKIKHMLSSYQYTFSIKLYKKIEHMIIDLKAQNVKPELVIADFPENMQLVIEMQEAAADTKLIFLPQIRDNKKRHKDTSFTDFMVDYNTEFDKLLSYIFQQIAAEEETYIHIYTRGTVHKIQVRDIRYCEINKRIMSIYYGDKCLNFYSTISDLEQKLRKYEFLRIHQSYLVNLKYVKTVTKYQVQMTNGGTLPVGKSRYKNIYRQLKGMNMPFTL